MTVFGTDQSFPLYHKWFHKILPDASQNDAENLKFTGAPAPNSQSGEPAVDMKIPKKISQKDRVSQEWLWDHKKILFMALAQLIIDKNEAARASGGEQVLIGKNLDLVEKDAPTLYHHSIESSQIFTKSVAMRTAKKTAPAPTVFSLASGKRANMTKRLSVPRVLLE
jgi:hypothetical protein